MDYIQFNLCKQDIFWLSKFMLQCKINPQRSLPRHRQSWRLASLLVRAPYFCSCGRKFEYLLYSRVHWQHWKPLGQVFNLHWWLRGDILAWRTTVSFLQESSAIHNLVYCTLIPHCTVIRFVSTSAKQGTYTVVSVNGHLLKIKSVDSRVNVHILAQQVSRLQSRRCKQI